MNNHRDSKAVSGFRSLIPPIGTMLLFGIAMILITPPFQAPDEPAHFYRAWQSGCFESRVVHPNKDAGADLFKDLHALKLLGTADFPFHPEHKVKADYYRSLFRFRLSSEEKQFFLFSNTAINHGYLYIPQAAGVILVRLLNAPPIVSLYLGRFLNLSAWCLCILVIIRLFPPGKWLFVSIALMPMSLFQASTLSADTLFNGTAFCFIALVLRNCNRNDPMKWKEICSLIALSALMLIGKQGYFPVLAMMLLIPRKRFGSSDRMIKFLAVWLAVIIVVLLVRFHQLSGIQDNHPGVVPPDQLAAILSHPMSYIIILLRSVYHHRIFFLVSFVGNFGWLDTPLPLALVTLYLLFIPSIALTTLKTVRPDLRQKSLLVVILLANGVLLMTLMYLYWTPVGAPIIQGVQGRYLIPLAPLAALLFANRSIGDLTRNRWFAPVFYGVTWTMLSVSLFRLANRYWG